MPAKSTAQQQAAAIALSAKRGETPVAQLEGAARSMHDSMTAEELKELAATQHDGKPERVDR